MSQIVAGASLLAGAAAVTFFAPELVPFLADAGMSAGLFNGILAGMVLGGASMTAGAIADALMPKTGMTITTRQTAAFRQLIYGEQRVAGSIVYQSTTGSSLDQYNMIIVLATHEIDSIVNLYLDGRQVFWNPFAGNGSTRNGVYFGGNVSSATHIGPGGADYNFTGLVFAEVRFGDQADGDVMASMTANDPNWAATAAGAPYLGGMAYMYLKIEYDTTQFPSMPEIRVTVRGKNNIIDPRLTSNTNTIAGAVTSGTFIPGEEVVQTSGLSLDDFFTSANLVVTQGWSIPGAVTSGTFIPGEQVIQTTIGANAILTSVGGTILVGTINGNTPNATNTWVGQTSGAIFTPTGVPAYSPAPVPVGGPLTIGVMDGALAPGPAVWIGQTSGAIFTATAFPVPTSTPAAPNVLATPTVLLNGWGPNAIQAAYEEGVDEGYNWGFNPSTTPGYNSPEAVTGVPTQGVSANISFQHIHQYAGVIWKFDSLGSTPSALWLNVNSMVNAFNNSGRSAGVWFSIDGGTSFTQIYNSPNHSQYWDNVELSPTLDTSQLQVMAFTDAHDDMAHYVYSVQLADGPEPNVGDSQGVFTTNWALIVADVISNADDWGLGDIGSVNEAQLIVAANVCDEQIVLAAGGTEAQWTCNWHYQTSSGPGDVLQTMMGGTAGRLSRIGGEWFIWPAYWQGPTFSYDESIFAGPIDWKPFRKQRDLFNRVTGTYVAANFPYNVAGNLYDSNGWYDGTIQNNFPFAFQPTNYPQYACDVMHGYSSDQYLAQDGGVQLPKELTQSTCLSVSQAQRAAKITLLRNRNQGSGTFILNLPGWQMQPLDVFQISFSEQGWYNKVFEIVSTQFGVQYVKDAPFIKYTCMVQETSPAIYAWNPSNEELSVYDVPANPLVGMPYTVAVPTSLTLTSNNGTAVTATDGTVTPRILVSWASAADALVTQYSIEYQAVGAGSWISAPPVSANQITAFISNVISGTTYNVQIQAQRNNGAVSAWVTGSVVAYAPNSTTNSYANTPQFDLTNPTSTTIAMGAVSVAFSAAPISYSARTFTIPVPSVPTWYYITIADALQVGESSPTLTATCSISNSLAGVKGNTYIGAIQVLPAGGSVNVLSGGWPAPSSFIVGD